MHPADEPQREYGATPATASSGSVAVDIERPHRAAPLPQQTRQTRKAHLEQVIRSEPRAVLLVNSRSRRGKRFYAEAKRLLESHGVALDARYSSLGATSLSSLVPDAMRNGHRLIIVGGGDGTLTSVLQHFVHRDAVLGILPLGTANSFARTLGIPLDLEGAVDVIVSGKVVDVDLGCIGEHYFSTVASVGLAAKIARHMPRRLKKWLGRLAYPLVALAQLRRYGAFRCTVTADGQQTTYDALEARVANGAYQGGVAVVREASAESRDLVVHITTGRSVRKLLRVWLRLAAGVGVDDNDVQKMRAKKFTIDAVPRQHVSVDGEAFIETPFDVSVAQQALLVMVPNDRHELE